MGCVVVPCHRRTGRDLSPTDPLWPQDNSTEGGGDFAAVPALTGYIGKSSSREDRLQFFGPVPTGPATPLPYYCQKRGAAGHVRTSTSNFKWSSLPAEFSI